MAIIVSRSAADRDAERPRVRGLNDPAGQFVTHAGRVTEDQHASADLRELGSRLTESDWKAVVPAAIIHRMAPLVFMRAAETDLLQAMSPAVLSALSASYRGALLANRRARAQLARILAAFAECGVETIALKGVALAARYYGDMALRPSEDIDLLVHRRDIPAAGDALRSLGYSPLPRYGRPEDFYALMNRTVVYVRADGPGVELHWNFTNRPTYEPSLDLEGSWARAETTTIEGRGTRYLHACDELAYLSVHCAIQHSMGRLIWLVDIARAACALPAGWDWEAFAEEMIARQLALPLATTLAYAHAKLGLALPHGPLARLSAAAGAKQELGAYRFARADRYSARWLWAQAGSLQTQGDRATFVRGAVAHVPTRVRALLLRNGAYRQRVHPRLRLLRARVRRVVKSRVRHST